MNTVAAWYDRFLDWLGELPGYIVVAIAFGITLDVILRNIGVGGIEWMIETVEYGLYILTFIGAAPVLRLGRHVSIDIVLDLVSPGKRRLLTMIANLLSFFICATLLYFSYRVTRLAFEEGSQIVKTYTIPEGALLAVMPPVALLLCIETMRRFYRDLKGNTARPDSGIARDGL